MTRVVAVFFIILAMICCTNNKSSATIQAKKYEFDYIAMLKAARKSENHLKKFLILAHCGIFDASGSSEYYSDIKNLYEHYGEAFFVKVLKSLDSNVSRSVVTILCDEFGDSNSEEMFIKFLESNKIFANYIKEVNLLEQSK